MDVGAATHTGYVRAGNEDGYFASRDDAVFAVADGMGGHEQGEVACQLTLTEIERRAPEIGRSTPTELPIRLHDTLQAANIAILAQAQAQDARNRMGTTAVLATICGDRLYFAHVGDSRLYLLRGDLFTQLTRDHSLVQAMIDRGEISVEEAAIHPLRHQITRVIGGDDHIAPEIASQALEPGDLILLCTDGLSGAVTPEAMKAILASPRSAQEKADALIDAALDAGGPDNITVVIACYQCPRMVSTTPAPTEAQRRRLPHWLTAFLTLVVLAVLFFGIELWGLEHPRYYVSVDQQNTLGLYMCWPLLPMRPPVQMTDSAIPAMVLADAQPYLAISPNIHKGIPVAGRDAGVALLQNIGQKTASHLCDEAKTAIDQHDLTGAQTLLNRAEALHADPVVVRQLQMIITPAAKKSTPK